MVEGDSVQLTGDTVFESPSCHSRAVGLIVAGDVPVGDVGFGASSGTTRAWDNAKSRSRGQQQQQTNAAEKNPTVIGMKSSAST